jgi:hypothetical protein
MGRQAGAAPHLLGVTPMTDLVGREIPGFVSSKITDDGREIIYFADVESAKAYGRIWFRREVEPKISRLTGLPYLSFES